MYVKVGWAGDSRVLDTKSGEIGYGWEHDAEDYSIDITRIFDGMYSELNATCGSLMRDGRMAEKLFELVNKYNWPGHGITFSEQRFYHLDKFGHLLVLEKAFPSDNGNAYGDNDRLTALMLISRFGYHFFSFSDFIDSLGNVQSSIKQYYIIKEGMRYCLSKPLRIVKWDKDSAVFTFRWTSKKFDDTITFTPKLKTSNYIVHKRPIGADYYSKEDEDHWSL